MRVIVGEQHTLFGDAIDVRRAVAHHPHIVGADVRPTDVITPDDEDVGLFVLRLVVVKLALCSAPVPFWGGDPNDGE